MERLVCETCGAPLRGSVCDYCGSRYKDAQIEISMPLNKKDLYSAVAYGLTEARMVKLYKDIR